MASRKISELPLVTYLSPEDRVLITSYSEEGPETKATTMTDLFKFFQEGFHGNVCQYCNSIASVEKGVCRHCGGPQTGVRK